MFLQQDYQSRCRERERRQRPPQVCMHTHPHTMMNIFHWQLRLHTSTIQICACTVVWCTEMITELNTSPIFRKCVSMTQISLRLNVPSLNFSSITPQEHQPVREKVRTHGQCEVVQWCEWLFSVSPVTHRTCWYDFITTDDVTTERDEQKDFGVGLTWLVLLALPHSLPNRIDSLNSYTSHRTVVTLIRMWCHSLSPASW